MNAWFKDRAWDNQVNNLSRTTVVTDAGTGRIVAYLTLAVGQIERAHLPKKLQRNKPLNIPILLLGQLAVDVSMQRKGIGPDLLTHALGQALVIAETVGTFAVLTHPLDDNARAFYRRYAFADLPGDPNSMILRIADIALTFAQPDG